MLFLLDYGSVWALTVFHYGFTLMQTLDPAFPRGPWRSDDEALSEIREFARNIELGGGAWGARFQSGMEGDKRRIGCSNAHGSGRRGNSEHKQRNGCDCRWGITLEKGSDGRWRLFSARNAHNHALMTSTAAALSGNKLLRAGIPDNMLAMGEMMAVAGIPASQINRVMQINAQRDNIPISWTYRDVRQRFDATTEQLQLDAHSLTNWIQMRREDQALMGDWRMQDGRLSGCWFVFGNGLQAYNAMGGKRTVFLDSTHNKNRYGLRLFIISCVGWSGNTEVRAFHVQ